jgi:hypothetical protein
VPWPFLLILLFAALLAVNWVVQVARKPSELVGVLDSNFHKSPIETWRNYAGIFREKSTDVMTPDLLAALAQMESNGNPIVRTYWKWRWTKDWDRLFAPASSAVGMFQITEGTFAEAKKFCVQDRRVLRDPGDGSVCSSIFVYSRLIPEHAIEMTSARLHYYVEKIVGETGRARRASVRDRQALATIIHLCGVGKGERFARAGFQASRIGRCGDHSPAAYLARVRGLQFRFKRLNEADERVTPRDQHDDREERIERATQNMARSV